jgi:phage gpG-like protein
LNEFDDLDTWVSDVEAMKARAGDPSPVLRAIADEMKEEAQEAFTERVSPLGASWAPTKPSTRAIRGGASTGRLKASLAASVVQGAAELASSLPYAGMQNDGNPSNRLFGHSVKPIPARPFSPIDANGNTTEEIDRLLEESLFDFIFDEEDPK